MTAAARSTLCRGWVLVLGLVALACGPSARGAISPDGFKHSDYAYRVLPTKDGRLMGESWKLDNYYDDTEFDAATGQSNKVIKPKDGDDYVAEYDLDDDGDGETDTTVKELVYDLRFKHLQHDGVIFLRTIPISTDLKQKKLSVLMDRYVEGIAGAGYEVVSLNSNMQMVVEKRYAAAVVSKNATKLGGRDAYVAILDVANIDQLKIDPKARKERVELVLLHTDFVYKQASINQSAKPSEYPVLMFVGYANTPDEFAAGENEFHDFLSRIEIDKRRGFEPPKVEPSETAPASETSEKPKDESPPEDPSKPDPASDPAKPESEPSP